LTNVWGWPYNGNFVNAEMLKAFIESIEYKQRFGQ